jgi:predicted RNase H-like HicB family nuclease
MKPVPVVYHRDPAGWWADSPAVPGWSAAADTLDELRKLAEDGVHFALESDDVLVNHMLELAVTAPAGLIFDFVEGRTAVKGARPGNAGEEEPHLRLAVTG